MPAPEIAQRIGWPSSYSDGPLKKLLARIRLQDKGIDPVDRVTYEPGQLPPGPGPAVTAGDHVGRSTITSGARGAALHCGSRMHVVRTPAATRMMSANTRPDTHH